MCVCMCVCGCVGWSECVSKIMLGDTYNLWLAVTVAKEECSLDLFGRLATGWIHTYIIGYSIYT